jgi:hypothetical protein
MQFLNNNYFLNREQFLNTSLKYLEGRKPIISHTNGNIYHLYHGSTNNRKYIILLDIANTIQNIEDILIQNEDGVFELTDEIIKDKMREYFIDRNDDEVLETQPIKNVVIQQPSTNNIRPSEPQRTKNIEIQQPNNINLHPALFNNPFKNLAPQDHWTRFKTK